MTSQLLPVRLPGERPVQTAISGLRRVSRGCRNGFSHFVTSMTAPIASGWSVCRVGLAPTGKRRLCTAHTRNGQRNWFMPSRLLREFLALICENRSSRNSKIARSRFLSKKDTKPRSDRRRIVRLLLGYVCRLAVIQRDIAETFPRKPPRCAAQKEPYQRAALSTDLSPVPS